MLEVPIRDKAIALHHPWARAKNPHAYSKARARARRGAVREIAIARTHCTHCLSCPLCCCPLLYSATLEEVVKLNAKCVPVMDVRESGAGTGAGAENYLHFGASAAPAPRVSPAEFALRLTLPSKLGLTLKIVFTGLRVFTPNPNSRLEPHYRFPINADEILLPKEACLMVACRVAAPCVHASKHI
ncbi:hypothetical protein ACJJTC_011728 [Scirpophaga incertulas]